MTATALRGARGLTLLEVMVALVMLSLVAVGYLGVFQGSHRIVARSSAWSDAIGYAADGMEQTKLELSEARDQPVALLPDGFRREVTSKPWQPGLALITVTVALPDGGRFELRRLARVRTPHR